MARCLSYLALATTSWRRFQILMFARQPEQTLLSLNPRHFPVCFRENMPTPTMGVLALTRPQKKACCKQQWQGLTEPLGAACVSITANVDGELLLGYET